MREEEEEEERKRIQATGMRVQRHTTPVRGEVFA